MTNFQDLLQKILSPYLHHNQPIKTIIKPIMAFSMHSHSGQFCPGHAKDSLEEIILRAISLKMHLLALTEHMPRDQDADLYPEEVCPSSRPFPFSSTNHGISQLIFLILKPIRSQQATPSPTCARGTTPTSPKRCGSAPNTPLPSRS
jgi:hypothetical protein